MQLAQQRTGTLLSLVKALFSRLAPDLFLDGVQRADALQCLVRHRAGRFTLALVDFKVLSPRM